MPVTAAHRANAEPRRGYLGRPRVVFILGQPALHERGLECTDDLLALGVGRAEPATVPALSGGCLIPWSGHHCASPPGLPRQRCCGKRNAATFSLAIAAVTPPAGRAGLIPPGA